MKEKYSRPVITRPLDSAKVIVRFSANPVAKKDGINIRNSK